MLSAYANTTSDEGREESMLDTEVRNTSSNEYQQNIGETNAEMNDAREQAGGFTDTSATGVPMPQMLLAGTSW